MTARLAVLAALLAAAAGCGGDEDAPDASTPAPAATSAAGGDPGAEPTGENAFIGSLAADPAGGTLLLGTGVGLFRAESGARTARRVVGRLQAPEGAGPVSSNLVVRYAGPGELLASGHPEGGGSALPEDLGLMRSADAGSTWAPVSQLGESDFHLLQARGEHVVAVRAEETDVLVSRDGGRGFEVRTPPDMPLDVAFDPADPARMAVATAQGVFTSDDEGRSWRPRDPVASSQLAWPAAAQLYRADPGGAIKASADGGATWEERGTVGLDVNELASGGNGDLLAAVAGGEVRRSTDGGVTWRPYLKLG